MRSYDDVVEVRGGGAGTAPGQFLWRGRLYVVREVLSHWYERTAWWDGAAARAVLGTDESPAAAGRPGGEREMWRVQATAGRSARAGVFDLAATSGVAPGGASWHLVRVLD